MVRYPALHVFQYVAQVFICHPVTGLMRYLDCTDLQQTSSKGVSHRSSSSGLATESTPALPTRHTDTRCCCCLPAPPNQPRCCSPAGWAPLCTRAHSMHVAFLQV